MFGLLVRWLRCWDDCVQDDRPACAFLSSGCSGAPFRGCARQRGLLRPGYALGLLALQTNFVVHPALAVVFPVPPRRFPRRSSIRDLDGHDGDGIPMSASFHCPYRQSALLQQALASSKMRIAFLLGAGCPVAVRVHSGTDSAALQPLIPDISGLTAKVDQELRGKEECKTTYDRLKQRMAGMDECTVEDVLSYTRALHDVVLHGSIDGLDRLALMSVDTAVCDAITGHVLVSLPHCDTPYH